MNYRTLGIICIIIAIVFGTISIWSIVSNANRASAEILTLTNQVTSLKGEVASLESELSMSQSEILGYRVAIELLKEKGR